MRCKGVRFLTCCFEFPNVIEVGLHPSLVVLLSCTNVELARYPISDFVYDALVSAHVGVVTSSGVPVPAVTGFILVVSRANSSMDLGLQVRVKELS